MDPTAANETLELILDLLARDLVAAQEPGSAGTPPTAKVEIDADARFATLGLDSARATAWLARLAQRLGRPLAPTLLWDHPTPAHLARFLDGAIVSGDTAGRYPSAAPSESREPIAIVGMSCRLPGATNPQELWQRLTESHELVDEVPGSRWPIDDFYHPDPTHPGTLSTRRGGFLDGIDGFDAAFFGISPHEARAMDPQQRLLLELAWESLEDAGIVPASLLGSAAGVFVGAMAAEYARQVSRQAMGPFSATGLDTSVLAGRLAYTLGLTGPALTVNTACSSSLVAVHLARRALDVGEVDLALAAGVHLMVLPDGTVAMTKFGGMAPDGRSKAFDARADGYVRAEGGAVVVLERWSRALALGHPIYGLIRGSIVNSDGFSNGLTAPNPVAQEAMLCAALADAGVAPESIDYVETHGPGTLLGDPIEAGALGRVLGDGRPAGEPLRIGSHKPHFGHLEAAAGIVGLVKTTLALRHRTLLPSLNFETPNPNIPFESLGLAVQTEVAPWPRTGVPPRAGVSAFGFSGTNAHVVLEGLEDGPFCPSPAPTNTPRPPLVFVFSGNGSQWRGMGRDLLREPAFRRRVADCDRRLEAILPETPHDAIAEYLTTPSGPDPRAEPGSQPIDQLALVATQLGLADLLASWGLAADAVVGHSVGEVTAACWAGALDLGDALRVVYHRARLQQGTAGQGALVVADHTAEGAATDLEQLGLAERAEVSAINGPRSIAVSGDPEALARLLEHWSEHGVECRATPVSIAFHGAAMEPLVEPLAKVLADLAPARPRKPMVSSVDGGWVRDAGLDGAFWGRHLRQPVRFAAAVETMLTDASWRPVEGTQPSDVKSPPMLVEIAPHPILGRPLDQILAGGRGHRVALMRRGETLFSAVGSAWFGALGRLVELGLPVPSEAFEPPGPERCAVEGAGSTSVRGPRTPEEDDRPWELIPFSAKTPQALAAMLERHGAWLEGRLARGHSLTVRRLAHQRAIRHSHLEHRRVIVARALDPVVTGLATDHSSPARSVFEGRKVPGRPPKMVWIFPGQGGQWRGMGRRLYAGHPVFRRRLEACERAVARHHARADFSVVEELLEGTDDAIDTVQPVLFSLQVALAKTLEHHGLMPGAVVGHSLGEVAAGHLAGLLDLDDAAKVICRRSRLLGRIRGRGSMLVTECDAAQAAEEIAECEDRVALAALNGPRSTVLSGEGRTLEQIADGLAARGIFQRPVQVEVASHSPLVDPLLDDLRRRLEDLRPTSPPSTPPRRPMLWSTVWNRVVTDPELDADYWVDNLRRTVRLWPVLEALVARGYDTFVEIGPHPVLLPAIEDGLRSLGTAADSERFHVVGTLRRDEDDGQQLAHTLATLWAAGADLAWETLQPTAERPLRTPTYPWQRQRFWIDDPADLGTGVGEPPSRHRTDEAQGDPGPHPWLGPGIESSLHPGTWLWQGLLDPDRHPELEEHRLAFERAFPTREQQRPVVPAGRWLDLVLAATLRHSAAGATPRLEGVKLREAVEVRPGQPLTVQLVLEPGLAPEPGPATPDRWRFQVATRTADEPWRVALSGAVVAQAATPPPPGNGQPTPTLATQPSGVDHLTHLDLRRSLGRRGVFVDEAALALQEAWIDRTSEVSTEDTPSVPAKQPSERRLASEGRWLGDRTPDDQAPLASLVSASFELLLSTLPGETVAWQLEVEGPSAADAYAASGIDALDLAVAEVPRTGLRGRLDGAIGDQDASATVTWFDDAGRVVLSLQGLRVVRATAARSRSFEGSLFRHHWRRLEALRPATDRESGPWLLVADSQCPSGWWAHELRRRLARRSIPYQVAKPESLPDPGGFSVVLWLASLDLDPGSAATAATEENAGWGGILDLWRRLRRATEAPREPTPAPRLVVASRHLGGSAPPGGHGPGEALSGLMAVARAEAPEHRGTWIALDGPIEGEGPSGEILEALVEECLANEADTPVRVKIDAEGRWIPELVALAPPSESKTSKRRPADGTWVISGGTGALGLAVARDLVAQGVNSLLLLARRPPQAAIRQALDALRARGVRIGVESVDVADATAVEAVLDRARREGPPLVGVVHAAGSSDDGPLDTFDRCRFRTVLDAKITGAWNLHHATADDPLDTFLLFGSIGALLGWPGQGAYATANAGLAALARWRRAAGLPALAIAWPGWSELGMAATTGGRAALAHLERQGLGSLTGVQGLALTRRWIADRGLPCEVVVLPDGGTQANTGTLGRIGGDEGGSPNRAGRVDAEKRPVLATELLDLPAGPSRRRALEDRLWVEVARVLGLAAADVERDLPWADLGLGSLLALELRGRLEALTGLTLSTTVVWSQPCLRDLAEHLAARLSLPLTPESETSPGSQPDRDGDDTNDGDDEADLLDWLDELAKSEL